MKQLLDAIWCNAAFALVSWKSPDYCTPEEFPEILPGMVEGFFTIGADGKAAIVTPEEILLEGSWEE